MRDCREASYTSIGTELRAEQDISSSHSTHCYPSAKRSHEGVNSAKSHAEDKRDGPLPISESEVTPIKVVHQLSSPSTRGSSPKRHKGKQKESPRGILKEFLNNFEDEMICPMSGSEQHSDNKRVLTFMILDAVTFCKGKHACICDSKGHELFHSAFAHLGNPCGHTFCGECGWRWIKKNVGPLKRFVAASYTRQRESPLCATCRASLSADAPMIPNFAVDSAVEKHVEALRNNGIDGWESTGTKFMEWQARKA